MRAVAYDRYGGADRLHVVERAVPAPRNGEVLVRIGATSINSWDWDKLSGNLMGRFDGPFRPNHRVLGGDFAGVVEAVGPGGSGFSPGDRVLGDLSESGWGGLADYATVKTEHLAKLPDGVGLIEASTLPQAATLALQGLRDYREVGAGDRVLINGGGGGVGSYAIQLAKRAGAHVTAVDHGSKAEMMTRLGADRTIDYQGTDYTRAGETYDLILDCVARRSLKRYRGVLNPGGVLVMVGGTLRAILKAVMLGAPTDKNGNRAVRLLMWRPRPAEFAELAEMVRDGAITPEIDAVYPLEEAHIALDRIGKGAVQGKAVIAIDPDLAAN